MQTKLTKQDTLWVIGLFGTAVGVGVLFLPIQAGIQGFWPLVFMMLISLPMTYFSHRGLARFSRSSNDNSDITQVARSHFGAKVGLIISILYLFSILPVIFLYITGLTNTVQSFASQQLNLAMPNRVVIVIAISTLLITVMLTNKVMVLKAISFVTLPQIAIIFVLSVMLIPQWRIEALSLNTLPTPANFIKLVWLSLPVLVFSFSALPAVSSFSLDMRNLYKDEALVDIKVSRILQTTTLMQVGFVAFFALSCTLALTPEQLNESKEQNISVLSYLANINKNNWFLGNIGPILTLVAITGSFFGVFLGGRAGIIGLYQQITKVSLDKISYKKIERLVTFILYLAMIAVAITNPNILGVEALLGPIIVATVFFMPLIAIYKLPVLHKYRKNRVANAFIALTGLAAFSTLIYRFIAA